MVEDKHREELINNEIENAILKSVNSFLEPYVLLKRDIYRLNRENQVYQVDHDGKKAIFELKDRSHTFKDIEPDITKYFALPKNSIFFKMEDADEILLSNLKVLPTIYPMIDSKFIG